MHSPLFFSCNYARVEYVRSCQGQRRECDARGNFIRWNEDRVYEFREKVENEYTEQLNDIILELNNLDRDNTRVSQDIINNTTDRI